MTHPTIDFFKDFSSGSVTRKRLITLLLEVPAIANAFADAGLKAEDLFGELDDREESDKGRKLRQAMLSAQPPNDVFAGLVRPLLDRATDAGLELLLFYANPLAGQSASPQMLATPVDVHVSLTRYASQVFRRIAEDAPSSRTRLEAVISNLS